VFGAMYKFTDQEKQQRQS